MRSATPRKLGRDRTGRKGEGESANPAPAASASLTTILASTALATAAVGIARRFPNPPIAVERVRNEGNFVVKNSRPIEPSSTIPNVLRLAATASSRSFRLRPDNLLGNLDCPNRRFELI